MLWGFSEIVNVRVLCYCVQHPWKFTGSDFLSSRHKRKQLSQQKCVLRKCCKESQKWWVLELSNLCHCVEHPWKLISKDFWSSRNGREWLSQQNCVFRNCCGVSQKWCMLELSKLCHCVYYPWIFTGRDFWSSRNERKPPSWQEYVLRKCCEVYQKLWMLEHFAIVLSTLEILLVGISGALRMKESHFLSKYVFGENAVGYLKMVHARALKALPLCSAPLKTYW